MKITSDTCLFGAYVAAHHDVKGPILDIGCGTGVLSLMIAQMVEAEIDAIEIDKNAAAQAKENFRLSPWANNLNCFHISVQDFVNQNKKRYSTIVCNPPFYDQKIKSDEIEKRRAWHEDDLTLDQLLTIIPNLMAKTGCCFLMLPSYRLNHLNDSCKNKKLGLGQIIRVKPNLQKTANRIYCQIVNNPNSQPDQLDLVCRSGNHYSKSAYEYLKAYYLNL